MKPLKAIKILPMGAEVALYRQVCERDICLTIHGEYF
jgi:hypothetical protein